MYQLTQFASITRLNDGHSIWPDLNNTDYAKYLAWVAEGNTPLPYVAPPPPPVLRVKMGQVRKALILKGVALAEVDGILDKLPEPQRSLAKVDWEFEPYVDRNNPLALAVAAAKGWTAAQVDDLFTLADSLVSGA